MGVNIELKDGKHRITSDSCGWTIEKLQGRRKDGSEEWVGLTFWPDLGGLLDGLAEMKIRGGNARTFEEIRDLLTKIHAETREIRKAFRMGG